VTKAQAKALLLDYEGLIVAAVKYAEDRRTSTRIALLEAAMKLSKNWEKTP
jgi:hypothetical protein